MSIKALRDKRSKQKVYGSQASEEVVDAEPVEDGGRYWRRDPRRTKKEKKKKNQYGSGNQLATGDTDSGGHEGPM